MVSKRNNRARSMKADRELIELAKTLDLKTIAQKVGRKPGAILITARRLGISIKGKKAK
jgi:hypothetical protein